MRFHGLRLERVRSSRQFDGDVFRNPLGPWRASTTGVLPMLPELLFGGARRRPKAPLPTTRPHEAWGRPVSSGLRTTWLGHSTVLIEIDGHRVLTDPVFGERASPVSFAGPKRFHPVPAGLGELPPLDAVVLSHDHYDHLCATTIAGLARMPEIPIVTSLGVGSHLERLGIAPERIHELDWGESCDVRGLRFIATPSQHYSGRSLSDRDATLWSSWVIQSDRHKVFFSGDTGLTEQFRETGQMYGPFDLVMLEIGAFHPGFEAIHLGPENALNVLQMLGGGTLLPVHWGTFDLALHAWDEPAETLVRLAAEQGLRVVTPSLGQVVEPSQLDAPTPWWRDLKSREAPFRPLAEQLQPHP
ncbi:MBL fold metallo-hydrolase [Sorangium sp. So ce1014]|uniref:MBL fold metallo-hydrolase n=1 Tax=Sorangium sp. So ce1014 TaxID=3133326 RepID=UPI003F60973C